MNMKQEKVALKSMAMKTRVFNNIHTLLHDVVKEKPHYSKYPKRVLTDKEKIEAFDKIFNDYKESKAELNCYKYKRQSKAEIVKQREERKKLKENEKI